ncbi:hypothetical protein NPIL_397111 [Nephila pilipes]|uniref:Uncharacterized protein n=1 Tax=Nephila pilipes TaxID=299642 RepID=A0A8X6T333_NEPPI|nr:hypothetical protein NPIL_397111 [Nephila pilipes]
MMQNFLDGVAGSDISAECPSKETGLAARVHHPHKLGWTRRTPRVTRPRAARVHHPHKLGWTRRTPSRWTFIIFLQVVPGSLRMGEMPIKRWYQVLLEWGKCQSKGVTRPRAARVHHPHKLGWTRRTPSRWAFFIFLQVVAGFVRMGEMPSKGGTGLGLRCPPSTQAEMKSRIPN